MRYLLPLIWAAAALLALQGVAFAVARKAGKHSVVDTAWGIGIAWAALAAFLTSPGHGDTARRALLLAASALWGARLAVYVGWRNHGQPEDPRYADLLAKATGNKNLYALRNIYLLQAAILWLATVPVQLGMLERAPLGPLAAVGAVLFTVGFFFESVGDWQLARFKADPAHHGMIMDRGLWRYTRHPNYFGDAVVRFGLWLLACSHWLGVLLVLSPVYMTNMLVRHTGKKLLEKHMARSKGAAYADYVRRTSGFIPWPPR